MVPSDVHIHRNGSAAVSPPAVTNDEAGLLDILAIVRRRFWLIVFGLAVGVGVAALYYFKTTPMYESTVRILVMPKDSSLPSQGASKGTEFQQRSAGEDILATHIELFQSPRVIQQAIDQSDLLKLPTLAKVVANDGSPVRHIIGNLEVTRGGEGKAKDASVLAATYKGPSADDCAAILEAIVGSYEEFLKGTFEDTSSEAVNLITEAMTKLKSDLEVKKNEYSEFRAEAPLLWQGENSLNVHQQRLASVEASLSEIAVKHTEAKSRLEVIEEALAKTENLEMSDLERLALLSSSDVQRLNLLLSATDQKLQDDWHKYREENPVRQQSAQTEYQRLLSLLLEEATLLEDFSSDHPKVQTVREQIRLTRAFLEEKARFDDPEDGQQEENKRLKPAELLSAHVGLLRHDLAELEKRRSELERLAEEEKKSAKDLSTYEIDDKLKREELDELRQLYSVVVDRLREINLIKDYGGFLTEVLAPVQKAEQPSWPVLPLVLALGGVCGLFFGCGLAYLVELSDKTFRSPDELHRALRLPIMAHVPSTSIKRRRRGGEPGIDPSVIAAHNPASRFAEVFRGLRTALRFSASGAQCRVLQVTSASPRDGKTTVAANLAVSFAQSGKRVLLVDGDLRRPRVDAVFGIQPDAGMVELLAGEARLDDAVAASGVENLWLLPCGRQPSNPAEVLSSPEFEQLVHLLREQYDLVIIDSPPVLAVSDPAVIAPRADGVLLTVRITKHGRPGVIQARQILAGIGSHLLGVVVNSSDKGHGFTYSRGYGYGYGSGATYGYGYGNGNDDMNKYYGQETEKEKELAQG